MRKTALVALVAAMGLAAAGCAEGTGYTTSEFRTAGVNSVAVVQVTGAIDSPNAQNQVAEIFAGKLRGKGYVVPPPSQAAEVLRAQDIRGPVNDPVVMGKIGKELNADSLLFVDVSQWNNRNVDFNARLVESESGVTLWTGSGSGETQKLWVTIGGAAAGAVLGGALGGSSTGGRVAGAVIGGAAGGAGGYFLTPDEEKIAGKVIDKMMSDFPARGPASTVY